MNPLEGNIIGYIEEVDTDSQYVIFYADQPAKFKAKHIQEVYNEQGVVIPPEDRLFEKRTGGVLFPNDEATDFFEAFLKYEFTRLNPDRYRYVHLSKIHPIVKVDAQKGHIMINKA